VRRIDTYSFAAVILMAIPTARVDASPPFRAPPIGSRVDDFTASDCLGTNHILSEVGRGRIVVLAFVGLDCPLAVLYTPRLVEMERAYAPRGVIFWGVDSNRQDGVTEVAAQARKYGVRFPILKDLRQKVANRVGATRTPEVIVVDRERKIRYRGRIDDQFGFLPNNPRESYRLPKPRRTDLAIALDELLAGKPVTQAETIAAGCLIGRDCEPVAHPKRTYTKDVAPILNAKCISCHRKGQIAPFSLTTFDEAVGWAEMIAAVTKSNRMPPWHASPSYGAFSNELRLSELEKDVLATWADSGAPEGNPNDLPISPRFTEGWTIPEPDQVLYMSDHPLDVPATGIVELKQIVVETGWKEDRWVAAVEPRPGNRSVVHHILIFVVPPEGGMNELRSDNMYIGCYSAGFRSEPLPPGYAWLVPAGCKLVFNMHYTPNGTPQKDLSYVGIKFADPNVVQHQVIVSSAFNDGFVIPAGQPNCELHARYNFKRDSLLLSLFPHMHLRGKDFRFDATYPNGQRETLLWVPAYDFSWQTNYRLATPKLIPKGTVIDCIAHYDNSEDNLNNPNPRVAVGFGWQSFEEMMVGFLEVASADERVIGERDRGRSIGISLASVPVVIGIVALHGALLGALLFSVRRLKA
jgi:peroxiredoxin